MSGKPLIVAIDGPSGAGKTAAGALLAERIGATLVDTGVFYRALTLLARHRGVSVWDGPALVRLASELSVVSSRPPEGPAVAEVLVNGEPVSDAIRSAEVDADVSEVAAHPEVRAALLPVQQSVSRDARVVAVGRDVGTVVFPSAQVKVYLDASPEERVRRRSLQVGAAEVDANVAEAIAHRDALDMGRPVAPLAQAADAAVVNTDQLSLEQVVDRLEQLVEGSVRDVGC